MFNSYRLFREDFTGDLDMKGYVRGVAGYVSEIQSKIAFEMADGMVKGTDFLSLLEELISKIAKVNLLSKIEYKQIKSE